MILLPTFDPRWHALQCTWKRVVMCIDEWGIAWALARRMMEAHCCHGIREETAQRRRYGLSKRTPLHTPFPTLLATAVCYRLGASPKHL